MINVVKDFVQPIGNHNKPTDCVRTECVADLVKYPFEYFNPMQSNFIPYIDEENKNVIVVSPTCAGKCINENSIILTNSGMFNFKELGYGILCKKYERCNIDVCTPLSKNGKDKAVAVYNDGTEDSIYLETRCGYNLTGTFNHRIRVVDGEGNICWKYLKEVCVNDTCVLAKGQNVFGNNQDITEEIAYCTGASFNKEDSIPLFIRTSPKNVVSSFIKGMYSEQGCLTFVNVGKKRTCIYASIALANENIVNQLHTILLNYGILAVKTVLEATDFNLYKLVIDKNDIHKFSKEMGFDSDNKKSIKDKVLGFLTSNSDLNNFVFDKVAKLEKVKSKNYDFIIPETKSFVAQGFINHNTTIAELSCAQALFKHDLTKKALYLAPMKSLAEEKLADWSEEGHSFSGLKITALTSDYVLNARKKKDLNEANIIVCTSEMLDSKTRTFDKNEWLHNVGVIIVDECHLLGSAGRGPRLETAIMRFTQFKKDCRLVLMSATCPNFKDYCDWLYNLTKKETVLVTSDYRPCVLNKHYVEVDDIYVSKNKKYADQEIARMNVALDIIIQNKNDQFMVFTGNKLWGRNFLPMVRQKGFSADFHNADLSIQKRRAIEKDFNSGVLQVLIASSTLAWGVNVNARRVILAHTGYGLTPMDIQDIEQVCGRAGRVKYHNEGDAYILIPSSKIVQERDRIERGFEVKSRLNEIKPLAFHVVSEIDNEIIKTENDLQSWYARSLSSAQKNPLRKEMCQILLQTLISKKMIKEENGIYSSTKLGNIAASMYQCPFNVYDWYTNFSNVESIKVDQYSDRDDSEMVDLRTCYSLANIDDYRREGFVSSTEKDSDAIRSFSNKSGMEIGNPVTKIAAIYWYMLRGKLDDLDDCLKSQYFQLYTDLQRTISTVNLIHSRYAKYVAGASDKIVGWRYDPYEWSVLYVRLKYGVKRHLTSLVQLPEIGKVLAEKLYKEGIISEVEVIRNKNKVEEVLGKKRADKLFASITQKV